MTSTTVNVQFNESLVSKLNASLDSLNRSVRKLTTAIQGTQTSNTSGNAITNALDDWMRGFLKLSLTYAKQNVDLKSLSKSVGLTTKELQEYIYTARKVGISQRDFSASMLSFSEGLSATKKGRGSLYNILQNENPKLLERLIGSSDTSQALEIVLKEISSNNLSSNLVSEIFSSKGTDIPRLVENGMSQLMENRAEAYQVGAVLSDEDIQNATSFNKVYRKFELVSGGILNRSLAELMAPLTEFFSYINEILIANKDDIKAVAEDFGTVLSGTISGLKSLTETLRELAAAIESVVGPVNWIKVILGAIAAFKLRSLGKGLFGWLRRLVKGGGSGRIKGPSPGPKNRPARTTFMGGLKKAGRLFKRARGKFFDFSKFLGAQFGKTAKTIETLGVRAGVGLRGSATKAGVFGLRAASGFARLGKLAFRSGLAALRLGRIGTPLGWLWLAAEFAVMEAIEEWDKLKEYGSNLLKDLAGGYEKGLLRGHLNAGIRLSPANFAIDGLSHVFDKYFGVEITNPLEAIADYFKNGSKNNSSISRNSFASAFGAGALVARETEKSTVEGAESNDNDKISFWSSLSSFFASEGAPGGRPGLFGFNSTDVSNATRQVVDQSYVTNNIYVTAPPGQDPQLVGAQIGEAVNSSLRDAA